MSDSTHRDPLLQADNPQFGLSVSSESISPSLFSLLERHPAEKNLHFCRSPFLVFLFGIFSKLSEKLCNFLFAADRLDQCLRRMVIYMIYKIIRAQFHHT